MHEHVTEKTAMCQITHGGFRSYEVFKSEPVSRLLCVLDDAAFADYVHLDLTGIFHFRFNLLGNIAGQKHHVGV